MYGSSYIFLYTFPECACPFAPGCYNGQRTSEKINGATLLSKAYPHTDIGVPRWIMLFDQKAAPFAILASVVPSYIVYHGFRRLSITI